MFNKLCWNKNLSISRADNSWRTIILEIFNSSFKSVLYVYCNFNYSCNVINIYIWGVNLYKSIIMFLLTYPVTVGVGCCTRQKWLHDLSIFKIFKTPIYIFYSCHLNNKETNNFKIVFFITNWLIQSFTEK